MRGECFHNKFAIPQANSFRRRVTHSGFWRVVAKVATRANKSFVEERYSVSYRAVHSYKATIADFNAAARDIETGEKIETANARVMSQMSRIEDIAIAHGTSELNQRLAQKNISHADIVCVNDSLRRNETFDVPTVVAEPVENSLPVFVHALITYADND